MCGQSVRICTCCARGVTVHTFVPAENPACCGAHLYSMDMKMTSSAKWHVSQVLHSPSSFRHCCIFGLLPWSVMSSSTWFQALCCSSSLSSLSSQEGGASAMLVFDVQMLWTGMMMWTDRTHVLAAQVQETTISVPCDTCHK